MIQFIIGGVAGYLFANAFKKGVTIPTKSNAPINSKAIEKVKEDSTINQIKGWISKDGNEVIIDLMKDSDYKNEPKFKDLGSDYTSAFNKLSSEIKNLPKKERDAINDRINQEGFDSAFRFYSDFTEVTTSKPFHDARKEYVKQSKRVDNFIK
jgi:hypothetical protein